MAGSGGAAAAAVAPTGQQQQQHAGTTAAAASAQCSSATVHPATHLLTLGSHVACVAGEQQHLQQPTAEGYSESPRGSHPPPHKLFGHVPWPLQLPWLPFRSVSDSCCKPVVSAQLAPATVAGAAHHADGGRLA